MMPPVSPCGLIVDFVRSYIRGKWRLYPTRPDLLTDAFLYKPPDGTRAVNAMHPFGSANWNKDKNIYPYTAVGQQFYAGAQWYDGTPPENLPPNALPWPDSDLSADLTPADPPIVRGNFDERCFTVFHPGVDLDPEQFFDPDISDCCWQRVLARLCELLVRPDPTDVLEFSNAVQLLWPGAAININPGNSVVDRIALVKDDRRQIIFRVGTQSWGEIFLQSFHLNQRAVDRGAFSTSGDWFEQSTDDIDYLDDVGYDDTLPTWFVGHSRGGAVNWLTARRLTDPFPARRVQVLTFGVPKVGDDDCVRRGNIRDSRHLANVGDPIPFIPPRQPLWEFLIPLYGLVNYNAMGTWQPFPIYQRVGGGQRPQLIIPNDLAWEDLADMIGEILAGRVPDPVAQHFMASYVAALAVCCSRPHFPFSDELWQTLFGLPDNAIGGVVVSGRGELAGYAGRGGLILGGPSAGFVGSGGLKIDGAGVVVYTPPDHILMESSGDVLTETSGVILLE